MQLKEVDGQLKAYKTSIDVINGLDDFSEFQVSSRVAYELQQSSSFLAENHWYLAVGSTDQTASILEWEITVIAEVLNPDIKLHIPSDKCLWQQIKAPVNDRTSMTQFELQITQLIQQFMPIKSWYFD